MYENSVTYQFVANVANNLNAGENVVGLNEGAVAIVAADTHNAIVAVADVDAHLKVAHRVNGVLKFSPPFTRNTANVANPEYAAPVAQVTHVGYNEVAANDGALDTDTNSNLIMGITLDSTQGIYSNSPLLKSVPVHIPANTDPAVAQSLHAVNFIKSFNAQFGETRLAGGSLIAERVNNGASVAFASDITVTNGSTRVVGLATTLTAGNSGAGDFVKFLGATYKVESRTEDDANAILILDTPYVGASGTVAGGATSGTQESADGLAANWGLRLTGVTPNEFDAVVDDFPRVTRFRVSYSKIVTNIDGSKTTSVSTADVTYTTAAFEGLGTSPEIAKTEIWTSMNEGNTIVSAYPPTRRRNSVIAGATYDKVVINGVHDSFLDVATGKRPISRFNIIIAANTVGDLDGAITTVIPANVA